jgi:hypothetical protein
MVTVPSIAWPDALLLSLIRQDAVIKIRKVNKLKSAKSFQNAGSNISFSE